MPPNMYSSVVCVVVVPGGGGAEYHNKYSKFVPTQHPILLPVPILHDAITFRRHGSLHDNTRAQYMTRESYTARI